MLQNFLIFSYTKPNGPGERWQLASVLYLIVTYLFYRRSE